MSVWSTSLAILLCVYFLPDASGSTIQFQTSASTIKPLISNNLTLTCTLLDTSPVGSVVGRSLRDEDTQTDNHHNDLDDPADLDDGLTVSQRSSLTQTTDNMAFVTSIMISRDGLDIATVTEHLSATHLAGASGFQVTGQVPGANGKNGYLELVWTHPSQKESGNYQCDIGAMTSKGRNFLFTQTLGISQDEVSVADLVGHLQKNQLEKEDLQATIVEMKQSTSHTIQQMNATIVEMKATIGEQAKTIGVMNQTIENMMRSETEFNHSLDTLINHPALVPNVFFSAALTHHVSIAQNKGVIYDKVMINEGGSYSQTTGVFHCPIDGFYHFEIHAYSNSVDAWLVLRQNSNNLISVRCYGDDGYRGSSNSVTLRLTKGDTVDVVGYSTSSSWLYGRASPVTSFSGRLLALA